MVFTGQVEAPPLCEDATGALRVGDSRVLLLARRERQAEDVRQWLQRQQGDLSEIRARLLGQRNARAVHVPL